MRRLTAVPLTVLSLTVLLLVSACGVESDSGDGPEPSTDDAEFPVDTTSIRYRFNDSSVPPEHHRSRTVTIDAQTTEIVVDSYGDEIGRDRVDTDPERWASFLADLRSELDVLPDPNKPGDGCDGGTSTVFEVTVEGETRFESFDERCGGQGGEQAAAIEQLIGAFLVDLDPES